MGSSLVLDKSTIKEHFLLAEQCYQRNEHILFSFFQDWLGCLIAGLNSPITKPLIQSLQSFKNNAVTNQYSTADKAMLFGFSSHCLELDDSEFISETHPSSVLFSALFSSINDKTITIKEIFMSASVGYLSLITLGKQLNPNHYEKGWHGTGTLTSLAATLALCHLHKLNSDSTSRSLGITSNLISGLHMNFGTEAKFLAAGRAAANAILATDLIKNGMEAKPIQYTGPKGFQAMFNGKSHLTPKVTANTFSFVKAKHFPVCHCLDPIIFSFKEILKMNEICKNQIKLVEVHISEYSRSILNFDNPKTSQEAKFSIPYSLSEFGLKDNSHLFINKNEVRNNFETSFAKKIRVFTDNKICKMDHKIIIHCLNSKVIKKSFSFDRGFKVQNRDFILPKVNQLISPYLKVKNSNPSFLQKLNSNIKDLSIRNFNDLINENIKLPDHLIF